MRRLRHHAPILAFLFVACVADDPSGSRHSPPPSPPVAQRISKETIAHGDRRVDDYFWLREKTNAAVVAYLEAENAYTEAVMKPTAALQQTLYQEMLSHWKQTDLSVPYRDGSYLYYSRTEEGKQYPIHCRKRGRLEAIEEVLLDLNELAKGTKFLSLGRMTVSDDGNLLAYSTDETGFRQFTLRVKDLRTGQLLPERIEKTGSIVWARDNRTLLYTVEDHAKREYRLYKHRLGETEHPLVYEEKDERFEVAVRRSLSKDWLFLYSASHTTSEVRCLPAERPDDEWKLIAGREADHEYDVEHRGDYFYIRSNRKGRNFALLKAPVSAPQPENWREVVPHRPAVMLEEVLCFTNHYVLLEREGGLPQFRVVDFRTDASHRIHFPEPVYTASPQVNAEFATTRFRYTYESLVTPQSVFDYDLDTRQETLLKRTEVPGGFDASRYQSERLQATAPDGTRVPVSLVYRKGLRSDGRSPLLLGGYGSYGLVFDTHFESARLSLLDRGVVVAMAHVRGGGELGKAWHDDGRMMKKRNTFTDFIAVAEFLIAEKFTTPDRLAIEGGSAGGLLMGAVTNLRPDLFKAVVAHVPFVDVINTMLDESLPLTVGEFEEWGNPKKASEYEYLKTYCPYTNLKRGSYPAILVTTSFNDSQVMYWEPAKYVARLRTLKTDSNHLLLKTNMAGGHGGASGRYDRLHERAFTYAFILTRLGVEK